MECALSWFYGRLRQWNGHRFAVSKGPQIEVDEVFSGPKGGRPMTSTRLDDRYKWRKC